ncbi:Predicted Na+-dependent transporter [Sphingomonas laterariae]|uniref:Predicted Na+-dependent transporter n=1 Tax=Edaphosphingomonas laterariae TaxID=861865 RepID=A0A239EIV5_9SPHN|nr:Na+-dependent transporter [Sphingomonas laterariae]SNS44331.1 Predicted Na+-dependent transporter [Sphingomonas laterariae]
MDLKTLIPLLLTGSIMLLLISVGMASWRGDFAYVLKRPPLLGKAMLAVNILPPLIAVIVTSFFPLLPAVKAGILLMAISPVPPVLPNKDIKYGGRTEYAYGIYAAMAICSIVTVPLLGEILSHYYGVDAIFPLSVLAKNVLIGVVVPLAIGIVLGRWLMPKIAHKYAPIISTIAAICVSLAFIALIIPLWSDIMALVRDGAVIAIAIIIALVLLCGHALGGPRFEDRPILAFTAATRHPGIALALAGANLVDKKVSAAVLLTLIVGLIVQIPYQIFVNRRAAAHESAAE